MSVVHNLVSRCSTFMPSFHINQKADNGDNIDISQDGQLDNLDSLKDKIIEGIFEAPPGKRQIPIEVMYQGDGADLIIKLGAGSLEKTQVLLRAVAQAPQIVYGVDYYALVESLASSPALKKVNCRGFRTYNNRLHHIASLRRRSDVEQVPRVFLWLGSGIENLKVEGAVGMVKSIANVMAEGHAVFDKSKFVYSTQVNHLEGRNECCCMASEAIELNYGGKSAQMERGERILVVPSYKYTDEKVIDMVKATGCLEVVRRFGTPDDAEVQYNVWIWRKVARQ
ncbi:hypothetical protein BGZ67_000400 [Mortierella alpina]|nr:hypothetical protein BGZ67_000400 [Mortierella alpina]